MKPDEVEKVGVVGCGLMGSGIAEVVARTGIGVAFVEVSDDAVASGWKRIEASTGKAVERGKMSAEDQRALIGRVSGGTDIRSLADVDLVIEAATEDQETKIRLFQLLDEIAAPDVVLATNTSSIPIAELAVATNRPDKVIGTHFFNPPPIMKLVPDAVARWRVRPTLAQTWRQYYGYARGDALAGMYPERHLLRFGVYGAAAIVARWKIGRLLITLGGIAYAVRPIKRAFGLLPNDPMKKAGAIVAVPALMFFTDLAKMAGYISGLVNRGKAQS